MRGTMHRCSRCSSSWPPPRVWRERGGTYVYSIYIATDRMLGYGEPSFPPFLFFPKDQVLVL